MHYLTVSFLRKSGYKVAVFHRRNKNKDGIISPKGGMTTLIIDSPHGEHFEGTSICCDADNYDKKLGIRIALGRSGVVNHISTSAQFFVFILQQLTYNILVNGANSQADRKANAGLMESWTKSVFNF